MTNQYIPPNVRRNLTTGSYAVYTGLDDNGIVECYLHLRLATANLMNFDSGNATSDVIVRVGRVRLQGVINSLSAAMVNINGANLTGSF